MLYVRVTPYPTCHPSICHSFLHSVLYPWVLLVPTFPFFIHNCLTWVSMPLPSISWSTIVSFSSMCFPSIHLYDLAFQEPITNTVPHCVTQFSTHLSFCLPPSLSLSFLCISHSSPTLWLYHSLYECLLFILRPLCTCHLYPCPPLWVTMWYHVGFHALAIRTPVCHRITQFST